MNTDHQSIRTPLAFFSLFRYPLTAFEVWQWQYRKQKTDRVFSYPEVCAQLAAWVAEKKLLTRDGFYVLASVGNTDWFDERHTRHVRNLPYWKRVRRIVQVLRHVPFVRVVATCNMFPIDATTPTSDIDMFIVVRTGRLWIARLLTTVVVWALGAWRHGSHVAGRLCLSFFITDTALDISPIAIADDIYLHYWAALVTPVWDRDNTYHRWWQTNAWVREHVPNSTSQDALARRLVASGASRVQRMGEWCLSGWVGNMAEKILRNIQYKKIQRTYATHTKPESAEHPASLVVNDSMLKFHNIDRRAFFREETEKIVVRENATQQ